MEAEIVLIEQRIANLETRLVALPENDETAFDLTIELSALEDQLNVRERQRQKERQRETERQRDRERQTNRQKRETIIELFRLNVNN